MAIFKQTLTIEPSTPDEWAACVAFTQALTGVVTDVDEADQIITISAESTEEL